MKEVRHDSDLCGLRVFAQWFDGLSPLSGHCTIGGDPTPAGTVFPGGTGRRHLCCCGVLAGMWLSGIVAHQAGDRCPAGPGGLWRRAVPAAVDAIAVRSVLRPGGRCPGTEPADRQYAAPGKRHFLYRCKRKSSAGIVSRGIFAGDCRVPGGGSPRRPGRTAADADIRRRPDIGADSPLGQWKRSPGPCQRAASAGDGTGEPGCHPARRSEAAVDTGSASLPGGPVRASASSGPGTAAPADTVPRGGYLCRAAAGGSDRLGGDLRNTLSRRGSGAFTHGTWHRVCGSLGRRCEKRRRP